MANNRQIIKALAVAGCTLAVLLIVTLLAAQELKVGAQIPWNSPKADHPSKIVIPPVNYEAPMIDVPPVVYEPQEIEVPPANYEPPQVEFDPRQEREITVDFESPDPVVRIEPSDTIVISPEFEEQVRRQKEESQKPLAGVFSTELEFAIDSDELTFSIALNNISDHKLAVQFDVGREYNITIIDSQGQEVFSRFYGMEVYLPAISHHELAAGEKLRFTDRWDYVDNHGSRVPPGKHRVIVEMLPMIDYKRNLNSEELRATADFELR